MGCSVSALSDPAATPRLALSGVRSRQRAVDSLLRQLPPHKPGAQTGRTPSLMPAARKPVRETVGDVLVEGVTKQKIRRLLDTALESTILVDAECPECGHAPIRAAAPDIKKQLDVLVALLEQAEGRPGQGAPGETNIIIERPSLG